MKVGEYRDCNAILIHHSFVTPSTRRVGDIWAKVQGNNFSNVPTERGSASSNNRLFTPSGIFYYVGQG